MLVLKLLFSLGNRMHKELRLPAPAKINYFLHITGRADNGYHHLQSLMQFIDWCDECYFGLDDHISLTIDGKTPCKNKDNLMHRAATLLQPYANGQGVKMHLKKHLPTGAGLGGGSSNAATTLHALNILWDCQLSINELANLGATLGADVPFFVRGQAALAEGIGDKLSPLLCHENTVLVSLPPCHADTKTMYADKNLTRDTQERRICNQDALEASASGQPTLNWHNDFLSVALQQHDEIKKAFDWLSQHADARLSGSGASIFACFASRNDAQYVAEKAPKWLPVVITRGLNQSPLFAALNGL